MKGSRWLGLVLVTLFGAAAACSSGGAGKTAQPPRSPQNPPDTRAAIPRPKPPVPESKFPPPQQSEEEERRGANPPSEPAKLAVDPSVFLDGAPFPERLVYDPKFPEASRTLYVSAEPGPEGDGSASRPWRDLQASFCRLGPGDRLVLLAGIYEGSFSIGETCRDGTAQSPIQVWAHHSFLKPSGGRDVLTLERAHWQFWELQIALLDSRAAGFVVRGAGAHDAALDQSHIYEGQGPAVRIEAGSARVTLSNCHIHQSGGVRVEKGAREVRILSNHIHHNFATAVTVSGEKVEIAGNRLHNDKGRGLVLGGCSGVRVSSNKFSNYRPVRESEGEAAVIGPGCSDVVFEKNTFIEASVGLRVDGGEKILVLRNFLENRLTPESTGLLIDGGRDVLLVNNLLDHYAEAIRVAGRPPGTDRISIANNLVLEPALAFSLDSRESAQVFEANVFSSAGGSARARIGADTMDLGKALRGMPGSRLLRKIEILDHDLARITGFVPVDAGRPIPGVTFRGAAPDIGVAEK